MRVLVVDDSAFMRRALSQILGRQADIEVVGCARNGQEAVEQAGRLKPDVITLDIEMPVMDGLTALRRIMRECPTQVLMCSSLTTQGSHAALAALKFGAADFIAKDTSQISLNIVNLEEDLVARIRALGGARRRRTVRAMAAAALDREAVPRFRPAQFDVICIGSSTGGPPVLETVLAAVPAALRLPIIVAQHMPELFTRSMTERLGRICVHRVVHTEDGMPVAPATVYIAPGGKNIHIKKVGLARYQLLVNDLPKDAIYRPSVDALLLSASQTAQSRTLAMIFTGMGEDGLKGGRALKEKGGTILAQTEETCVVYGMPKAVTENGLVAASLAPEQMALALKLMAEPAATPPAPALAAAR